MKLIGEVVGGHGLATEWVADAREPLALLLGAEPHPGTLNLLLRRPVRLNPHHAGRPLAPRYLLWTATCSDGIA